MKIRVTDYRILRYRKKEVYITISFEIDYPDGNRINKCKVNISKIGYFIGKVPDCVTSFLLLSAMVYTIDRSVNRERYSEDGWSRLFDVDFILPAAEIYTANKVLIEGLLSYLTGDYWTCSFASVPLVGIPQWSESHYFDDVKQVNLFSGGMDSLIGAIDSMERVENGTIFFASHNDGSMGGPKVDQDRLLTYFKRDYAGKFKTFGAPIRIEPDFSQDSTCRSRSLMFIAIALQVAVFRNLDIVIPENGSVSLNYPLSPSRRASCSTRTTHPVMLMKLRNLFASMGLQVRITNPYEFMTKGEMVKACANQAYLLDVLSASNSCGKRARKQFFKDNHHATHCGRCMPCMYRKAALVGYPDRTVYGMTINRLFREKVGDGSDDFYAMINFLKRDLTDEAIARELRIAGMGRFENLDAYVQLVKRTREELKCLINAEGSGELKGYIGI